MKTVRHTLIALGCIGAAAAALPAAACDLHGAGGFAAFHGGMPGFGGDAWGYQPFVEDDLVSDESGSGQGVTQTPVAKPLPTFATPAVSAFEKAQRARAEKASTLKPTAVKR